MLIRFEAGELESQNTLPITKMALNAITPLSHGNRSLKI
jgi:hypothetical protein